MFVLLPLFSSIFRVLRLLIASDNCIILPPIAFDMLVAAMHIFFEASLHLWPPLLGSLGRDLIVLWWRHDC